MVVRCPGERAHRTCIEKFHVMNSTTGLRPAMAAPVAIPANPEEGKTFFHCKTRMLRAGGQSMCENGANWGDRTKSSPQPEKMRMRLIRGCSEVYHPSAMAKFVQVMLREHHHICRSVGVCREEE